MKTKIPVLRPVRLKVVLWAAAIAGLVLSVQAQNLSQRWHADVTTGRGIAFNPATGNLLLGQTTGIIRRFNPADGSEIGDMDSTGVSGGTWAISGVTALPNGTIFACNYVPGATTDTNPLKVYRWADEAATPELVATLNTLPGAATDRFGEHLRSFVTPSATNLLIAGNATTAFLLVNEGDTWTFKQLTVDSQVMRPSGSFIDYSAPGFPNRFRVVAKSRGTGGQLYNFDPSASSPINLTLAANKSAMTGGFVYVANGVTSHGYDPETGLLGATTSTLQTAGAVNPYTNMIFITTNGVANPVELARVTIENVTNDGGTAGGTVWAKGRLITFIPIGGAGIRGFDVSAFLISAPTSATKVAGQSVTFATVFGGTELTYEWKKGASVISDGGKYSGATTRSLTISNLADEDADVYTVTATDVNGGTAVAVMTLNMVPARVWTGGGADDNWTTPGNWGGTALATGGEFAVFAGTTRLTPVMNGSYDVTGLLFSSTAGAFHLTNSAGTLTLSGTLLNESAHTQTISLPVELNSAQTADIAAPVTITGTLSGSGALSKSGEGMLTLAASNTHTGPINITGGPVAVTSGSAISDTAIVTLGTGGALQVDTPETIGGLAGSASSVILNQKLTIGGAGGTYTGGISGPNDLEIAATGTQALHSGTTYSGRTILTAGTLSANDSTTFGDGTGVLQFNGGMLFRAPLTTAQTFANAVEVTANSTIAGNPASGTRAVQFGANSLTAPAGTLTITNSATSGSGVFAVRINGTTANCTIPIVLAQGEFGVVELGFASAVNGAQVISGNISGNGRVLKNSASASRQTTFTGSNSYSGNLVIGAGRVNLNHNHAAGAGMIVISNATTIALASTAGAGIVITNNIHLLAGANPIIYADGTGSSLELRGVISGTDGTSRLTRNNTGNNLPILAGDNTFAGGVTIISRTLQLKHRNALGTGDFTIGDPATAPANTINISAGVPLTGIDAVANTTYVNQNFTVSGTNALELSGGVFLNGARTITVSGTSSYAKFSGSFNGQALTKAGTGTLELSGNPYLSEDLTVSAGTLLVNTYLFSGPVSVPSAGTLSGTGTLAASVAASGTVAPGTSVGTLTLANGLDLSSGGTYEWELGSLSTDPGAADVIVLSGGNLSLGGSSRLSIKLTGTATPPSDGDPFWSSPRTWTIVNLAGGSNWSDTDFYALANSVYTNGLFTTSVSGGNVLLHFTPGSPPRPEVESIVGPAQPSTDIEFTTPILRVIYRLLYKNDLNDTNWTVLGSVVGTGASATLVDTSTPKPPQRFYRIVVE